MVYFDSTDPGYLYPLSIGQTIKWEANATGYNTGTLTFSIPYSNYKAYLNLVPTSIINATGTGNVVVNVVQ